MATLELKVLEESEKLTPKSALRYRPIGNTHSKPPLNRHSVTTNAAPPSVQRASRPPVSQQGPQRQQRTQKIADEKEPSTKVSTPESVVNKPQSPLATRPIRTVARPVPVTPRPKPLLRRPSEKQQAHPLLYLGLGMIAMLLLWTLVTSVSGWFSTWLDDMRYGRPRTFQTDQFVGHNEQDGIPSHFIAINLNRRIEIIEFPGGDATHAKVYLGPQLYGSNDDLVPVTLTFIDVNGDHKPDMIVNFQSSRLVFINDQGSFRPMLPSESPQIEQFLKRAGLSS